jgi:hypothetical protein
MELSNESSVYLGQPSLVLPCKYLAEPHDLGKSLCLMLLEMRLGLHLSHELLLQVSLVDQVDIFLSLDLVEMASMHHVSSKMVLLWVSEPPLLDIHSMLVEHSEQLVLRYSDQPSKSWDDHQPHEEF